MTARAKPKDYYYDRFDPCRAAVIRRCAFHEGESVSSTSAHSLKRIFYGTLLLLNLWMLTAYAGGILNKNRKPQ